MTILGWTQDLGNALQKHQTVYCDDKGVHPLGYATRIWHWKDKYFHATRVAEIAKYLAGVLQHTSRRPRLEDVRKDPTVEVATRLKREIKKYNAWELEGSLKMMKELSAIALGIDSFVFDANPGFQQFAEKYVLNQYLIAHGNTLQVDLYTSGISLYRDGVNTSWTELKDEIDGWSIRNAPSQPWVYGDKGIQNRNMYDWKEFTTYKHDPNWNGGYAYQLCVWRKTPNNRDQGGHSWLEFYTPNGDMYSAGLYAGKKDWLDISWETLFEGASWTEWFSTLRKVVERIGRALMTQPAHVMSPDVSIYWPTGVYRFPPENITQEQFNTMKGTIENFRQEDLDPSKGLVFQAFNNSCLMWSKTVLGSAGIQLTQETGLPPSRVYFSKQTYSKIHSVYAMMPTPLKKISSVASTVFWNGVQWCLGANVYHSNFTAHQRSKVVISFNTISDFFREQLLHHPGAFIEEKVPEEQLTW